MEDEIVDALLPEPALLLRASDEEVLLYVEGFAVLRAIYEAEGYYDESGGGEPAEEDLYRIEVLDAHTVVEATEALENESRLQLVSLGLDERSVRRLFPAERWSAERDANRLVQQYLLALGSVLHSRADSAARQRSLEASVHWSPAIIQDRYEALPSRWRQAPGLEEEATVAEAPEDV